MNTSRKCRSLDFNPELGLKILDQRALPHQEIWQHPQETEQMVALIQSLAIRGAPAIAIASSLFLATGRFKDASPREFRNAGELLASSRPTAVNLKNNLDYLVFNREDHELNYPQILQRALFLFDEDEQLCLDIANCGLPLIPKGSRVLTHCNTGGLATCGIGTALGVIIRANQKGLIQKVYVDETRPLLQGARLTAYECLKENIPFELITDSMGASLMSHGKIDLVIVGADRICRNGDFANKIGTYGLAVWANYHHIPFYVAAPHTTIDVKCQSGADIPIEQRDSAEVRGASAPVSAPVYNPAFDVTPVNLITGAVFNHGYFDSQQLQQGKHL